MKPKMQFPVQITIYHDGKPIGGWIGMVPDPTKVTVSIHSDETDTNTNDVTPTPNTVVNLARRTNTYTTPRPHMQRFQRILDTHDDLCSYVNPRAKECPALAVLQQSIAKVWWDWFDERLSPDQVRKHHERIQRQTRLVYAAWLLNEFEAYGKANSQARNARATTRDYIASFKRGGLKLQTFTDKLDVARRRLDLLRRKP